MAGSALGPVTIGAMPPGDVDTIGPAAATELLVVVSTSEVVVAAVVDVAAMVVDEAVVGGEVAVVAVVLVVVVGGVQVSESVAPRLDIASGPNRTATATVGPSRIEPEPLVVAPATSSTPLSTSCAEPDEINRSVPGWTELLFSPV